MISNSFTSLRIQHILEKLMLMMDRRSRIGKRMDGWMDGISFIRKAREKARKEDFILYCVRHICQARKEGRKGDDVYSRN
jgi:hypothetical protein